MSNEINVAPAPGVTPVQAAKKLRTLIKDMYRNVLSQKPATVNPHAQKMLADAIAYHERAISHDKSFDAYLSGLTLFLRELVEVSKARRPSETKQRVDTWLQYTLPEFTYHRKKTSDYWENTYTRARDAAATAATTPQPVTGVDQNAALLREAYALVQVIPTVENPPSGKAENSLRAITAIVKAHHGLLMEGPERIPSPAVPIVLVETVIEKQEIAPALVERVKKAKAKVHALPYMIVSGEGVDLNESVPHATTDNGYGYNDGEPWTNANWNGGECSWDDAVAALRAVRRCFSDDSVALTDADGQTLAVADIHQEIEFYAPTMSF